jgi:hypothetical protein
MTAVPLLNLREPTLVFVGGRMTLVDGSVVDSRQRSRDAVTAQAVSSALTASPEWWTTVSSIVLPTLDGAGGGSALILGQRSVSRTTSDGEIKRSRLKRVLQGGIGSVSIQRSGINEQLLPDFRVVALLRNWEGVHMGSVGVRVEDDQSRWRFLEGTDFYLRLVADQLAARVVVDTTGAFLTNAYGPADLGSLSAEFSAQGSRVQPEVIVIPDTTDMLERVEGLLARIEHSSTFETFGSGATAAPSVPLRLQVLRADCTVTRVLRAGEWVDAGELEAARRLLLERFDLKVGLWDLALNPVLRSTVLDPSPAPPVPDKHVETPASARDRARRQAERTTAQRAGKKSALSDVSRALHAELSPHGWIRNPDGLLSLPLTERLPNWPDGRADHLALLKIEINKSSGRVLVWQWLYNDLNISDFVEERRDAFEAIAPLPKATGDASTVDLWTLDHGWGDRGADWRTYGHEIARRALAWTALLADFVATCRAVRKKRFR